MALRLSEGLGITGGSGRVRCRFVDDEALSCGLYNAPASDKPAWNNELHTLGELLRSSVFVDENTSTFENAAVLLLRVLNFPFANFAGPDPCAELAVR